MQNAKLQFKIQDYKNIKKELPKIQREVSLAKYTTFRIGGPAKFFFRAKKKEDIIKAIAVAKKFKLPFFILGGGSNLLVADEGYEGLVIKCQMSNVKCQMSKIFTEAGMPMSKILNRAVKNNLTGLEWTTGIPGATVGGAIRGNAGAFGSSLGEIIKEVEVFDIKNQRIKKLKQKDCKFSYRDSVFKKNKNLIILSAILQLKKENRKEIKKKIKEHLKYRKKTQPLNFPSAGSIFKNPQNFSAGELIERSSLKGKKISKTQISEKHANFIVNLGGAKAKDVKKLINLIKKEVKNKFRIKLEEEIQYLGG